MDSLAQTGISQHDSLARRYGAAVPPLGPWNDTIAGLLDHRSVRAFLPDALPPGTLETLIAAAQSAATSSNMQLWSAVAVSDPAKLAVLAEIAGNQKHIAQCPLYIAFVADISRNERMSRAEGATFENIPYLETFMVACIDAALAAQNAVVAAESLGLRTVYIGAMRNDPARVHEMLGLPEKAFVVFGLCVGYADPKSRNEVKPRLPQSSVLHHDRYQTGSEVTDRAAYDAELLRFSTRHEMQATTWTARMLNRMGPLKAMQGRDRLRGMLAKLGFEIR